MSKVQSTPKGAGLARPMVSKKKTLEAWPSDKMVSLL